MNRSVRSSILNSDTTEFSTMLHALSQPAAFPFPISADEPITVAQTHASAVLLVHDRAYKLKKPKDFGFFDYSTPALRRHFCCKEVTLNVRLAPHVYLGVAPVLTCSDGNVRFGATFAPENVPLPGTTLDGGKVIDYAVVMERLPDEATLESRVRANTASPELLAEVARHVATFHSTTHTDQHIASFGMLDVIRGNWEENFAQMKPYVGRSLDAATYDHIVGYIRRFMQERTPLFASRVRDGRIRDCHGDLRLQHVYSLDKSTHQLAILDCIEFNERFRYSDVASEVAFLTMELDAAGRSDLSRAFIEKYVKETGDEELPELLPFYTCYRACVRGKVLSFQLDEPEVPETQRELVRGEAASLFALAASYASGPTSPTLILVGGLMGTGKSTLAASLHHELGWTLLSSDEVRKRLARLDPIQPHAVAFGQGLYGHEWTVRTYTTLISEAGMALANGRSVLLDASFTRRSDRQTAANEARAHGANVLFVECACPREIALERLARRWLARVKGGQVTLDAASRASDGRPELYDAQWAAWEGFVKEQEPGIAHIQVTTTHPLTLNIAQVLDTLNMPRFACWL